MLSSRISMKPLSLACRSLSTTLHSGVDLPKAFELAAGKAGDGRCRRALLEVSQAVTRGNEVAEAMDEQGVAFPELMVDMVNVGEKTGALPEVLQSLSSHYDNLLRMRRTFYGLIALPVIQMIAAILIVAALIFILGLISTPGVAPIDVLGLGLTGASGAMTWLAWTFGTLIGLIVGYQVLKKSILGRKFFAPLFLRIPVVGNCLRSFAVARFSWAFALTQQSGMPIRESLEASLKATSNGAFQTAAPRMWKLVKAGEPLHAAMADSRLFPGEYLHMVEVAEHSGTIPEMLEHLSPQFEEQARRNMAILATVLGWLVWLAVAAFIIYLIFTIVMRVYIGPLNDAVNDAMKL